MIEHEAGNLSLRRACDELGRRLRSGQLSRAEDFLASDPTLSGDADAAVELVYTEFVVREELDQQPQADEWLTRFPQWKNELAQVFEVHRLVSDAHTHRVAAADTHRDGELGHEHLGADTPSAGMTFYFEGYQLIEEIGRGGMGVVYKARQIGLDRLVALKMILPPHGPRERARFRTEAEATARLSHPSIVQIYEVGQESDCPFLAMEFVAGTSLDKQLADSPLSGRAAAELLLDLALAVAYAHKQGIVHRDLKPANILLAADGSPKITDFGLARRLLADDSDNQPLAATQTGAIVGTPSYMAPEQCGGTRQRVGPAADVYALGAVLYEALTGRPPFRGQTPLDTLELVRSQEPVSPRRLVPKLPRDLETICLKCLAKQPQQRYGSAAAFAVDLRRFLSGEPILARPAGRTERAIRWSRRNPAVASLLSGIALLLVCGTTIASALAIWAMREKGRADEQTLLAIASAKLERAARELAEIRFTQAEMAVGEYLDGIENNERLKEADFFDLRKQLLASAIPFYEEFVRQKPSDAVLEAKRGQAYIRLASLRRDLGEREQAIADYRRAQAIFQKLAADFPSVLEYRQRQAQSHRGLGVMLYQLGKRKEAEAEHRRALAIVQPLADEFPNDPGCRSELAASHANLGVVLCGLGNKAEAAAEYRQAINLRQSLVTEYPDVAEYRILLAYSYNNLGMALAALGKQEEAAAEYHKAIDVESKLVAEFPNVPDYRQSLARAHNNLGNLLGQLGKPTEAVAEYRKALPLIHRLVADFPSLPEYRNLVATIQYDMGIELAAMGKPEEAKAEYRAALQTRTQLVEQFPGVTDYRHGLGQTLNNLAVLLTRNGELDEARRMYVLAIEHQLQACRAVPTNHSYADSLRNHYHGLVSVALKQKDHAATADAAAGLSQARPDVADDALRAARFLGYCISSAEQDTTLPESQREALMKSYADQAMESLREAVRRGLKDVKQLKTTALRPLYGRSDFKQLVQNMHRVDGALEGEDLKVVQVTAGAVNVQSMTRFMADEWSGNKQLYWSGAQPGARLDLAIEVSAAATYDFEIVLTKARDYGMAQLWLDEVKLGDPVDLFDAKGVVTTGVLKHSGLALTPGRHVLSFEIVGVNPAAVKDYMIGLDYVRILPAIPAGQ
jgi:eukaryotic-like serine/threonine-protein kinase